MNYNYFQQKKMGMDNSSRNITALNNSFFDLIKLDDKLSELRNENKALQHKASETKECPTCTKCPLDHEYNKVINCEQHVHEIELLRQQVRKLEQNECPNCPNHVVAINESNEQLNDAITKYNKLKLKHNKSKLLIREDDEKIDDANNKVKHITTPHRLRQSHNQGRRRKSLPLILASTLASIKLDLYG